MTLTKTVTVGVVLCICSVLLNPLAAYADSHDIAPAVANSRTLADKLYTSAYSARRYCHFDNFYNYKRKLEDHDAVIGQEMDREADLSIKAQWQRLKGETEASLHHLNTLNFPCDKPGDPVPGPAAFPTSPFAASQRLRLTAFRQQNTVPVASWFEITLMAYTGIIEQDEDVGTTHTLYLGIFDSNPGVVSRPTIVEGEETSLSSIGELQKEFDRANAVDLDAEMFEPRIRVDDPSWWKKRANTPVIQKTVKSGKLVRQVFRLQCLKVGTTNLRVESEIDLLYGGGDTDINVTCYDPATQQGDTSRDDEVGQAPVCGDETHYAMRDLGPKPGNVGGAAKGLAGGLLEKASGGIFGLSFNKKESSRSTAISSNDFKNTKLDRYVMNGGINMDVAARWVSTNYRQAPVIGDDEEEATMAVVKESLMPLFSMKIDEDLAEDSGYMFTDMYLVSPECKTYSPSRRLIYEVWKEGEMSWGLEFWQWHNDALVTHWNTEGAESWSKLLGSGDIPVWVGASFKGLTPKAMAMPGWMVVSLWTFEKDGHIFVQPQNLRVEAYKDKPISLTPVRL